MCNTTNIDAQLPIWVPLMLAVSFTVFLVPPVSRPLAERDKKLSHRGVVALARLPAFRRIVLVAALILSVIRWNDAGISPRAASVLWSLAVAAEVVVFFVAGPWLLQRLSPATAIGIAAVAGAGRWLVSALTVDLAALVLISPFHGITFSLLHLSCMRLLAKNVPQELAATAQAIYGTVGVGVATALLTLASGWLYARMGASAFLAMDLLCLAALPLTRALRRAS